MLEIFEISKLSQYGFLDTVRYYGKQILTSPNLWFDLFKN